MISVIIPTLNSVERLQALLTDLVPATVDGLVREVLVADGGSTDETAALCEDAGALLLRGGLADAAAVAKSDRVLVLPAEMRLPHDWARDLADHLAAGGGAAIIRPHRRGLGWFAAPGEAGLLITRIQLLEHGRSGLQSVRSRLRRPVRIG